MIANTPNVSNLNEHPLPDRAVREQPEPSLGTLLSAVTEDLTTLIRQEIDLARTETMAKIANATQSVVWMVAGGLLAYAGLITLIIAAVLGLAAFMPFWLSALVVGLVVIVVGMILLQSGRSSLAMLRVMPEQTVASLKEDTEMVKEKVS